MINCPVSCVECIFLLPSPSCFLKDLNKNIPHNVCDCNYLAQIIPEWHQAPQSHRFIPPVVSFEIQTLKGVHLAIFNCGSPLTEPLKCLFLVTESLNDPFLFITFKFGGSVSCWLKPAAVLSVPLSFRLEGPENQTYSVSMFRGNRKILTSL